MSWLLFLDESGHDHKTMPYEVRGGVTLRCQRSCGPSSGPCNAWNSMRSGPSLAQFRKELKGSRSLDKDRFKWASQGPVMSGEERRKHCRGFLTKGLEEKPPSRDEFTAYGQGCLEIARGLFQTLADRQAVLFAVAIPRATTKPDTYEAEEYLRKDQVFLLERFFYFLEEETQHGLIVMDEVEKTADRHFVRRLHRYFAQTATGRYRSHWIVPSPFFVASDMASPVQAADLCIYCINWGFGSRPWGWTPLFGPRSNPSSGRGSIVFSSGGKAIGMVGSSRASVSPSCLIPTTEEPAIKRRQGTGSHPKAAPSRSLHLYYL